MHEKKRILQLFIISTLCCFNVYSQNKEIKKLEKEKKIITEKIKVLEDSLKNTQERLSFLKSKDSIKIDKNVIAKVGTLKEVKIRDKPKWSGNVVAIIPKYKMVNVYSYDNGYWLIKKDSIKGYVKEDVIGTKLPMMKMKKEIYKVKLTKKYDKITAIKISNKSIWIGMTSEMAIESIGRPKDINRTKGAYGTHEQWVYDNKYLYFEDGILKSWQD